MYSAVAGAFAKPISPGKPREGQLLGTATTGSDGQATLSTSQLSSGTYRIRAKDLTIRTVELTVNNPTPTSSPTNPDPAPSTPKPRPNTNIPSGGDKPSHSAQVKVKSVAKKSQIKIDVNPDNAAGP